MILLHAFKNRKTIFVNPYYITEIRHEPCDGGTMTVVFIGFDRMIYVDESPEEVAQMVHRAITLWRKG